MGYDFGVNQALVEELYFRYQENPASVSDAWRKYFEGLARNNPGAIGALDSRGTTDARPSSSIEARSNGRPADKAAADKRSARAEADPKAMRRSSLPPMMIGDGRTASSSVFSLPPTAEVVTPFGAGGSIAPSGDVQA